MKRAAMTVALVLVTGTSFAQSQQPYAGQQTRPIKALSDADVASLRKGEGMGMAKAAELNRYPGPSHVLALADQLALTADQRRQVAAIFERMSAAAKSLGGELIAREQVLDQLFAKAEIKPESLAAETMLIAQLNGRLRAVHLAAHLETRELLRPAQIAQYEKLRGYHDGASRPHRHPG